MKKLKIFPYILVFLGTFLILQIFQGAITPDPILSEGPIGIQMVKDQYTLGKDIKVEIQNNQTTDPLTIGVTCYSDEEGNSYRLPSFTIERYTSEAFVEVEVDKSRLPLCDKNEESLVIDAGKSQRISLLNYSNTYFGEIGRYRLSYTNMSSKTDEDLVTVTTPEFEIKEPGIITTLWRSLIYRPILNALVAILIYMPQHKLWLAVVLLTLIIRTILLLPSQKAFRAQKRMQEVQPKLEEIKKKYKDDQARIAQETMAIWQKHKVSPVSSCLPMLIQFPILIALFYVIKNGLNPDKANLIYNFLPEFALEDINTWFLNFNLLEQSKLIFPIVIGLLQFFNMQLMTAKKHKKKGESKGVAKEMESANAMMKYLMPLMIAFFTSQMPAAVGLYWGTSTFYGIIQQLVINKEGPTSNSQVKDDDVKVRVINKSHGKRN